MKKIQTASHKKTTIGKGSRTVGLTSQPRIAKTRTTNKSIVATSRAASKKATGTRRGCSGCSRNRK